MTIQREKLAYEIYQWLLTNPYVNTKRISELLWVVNLTVVDSAIMVIQLWLQDNEHINSVEAYQNYVS